jgi:hypothetical protein
MGCVVDDEMDFISLTVSVADGILYIDGVRIDHCYDFCVDDEMKYFTYSFCSTISLMLSYTVVKMLSSSIV